MNGLLATLVVGIASSIPTLSQDPDLQPKVQALLLVTGDRALIERTRKEFRTMPVTELPKLFPPARFEIVVWDERQRLVIDRTTGPLGKIQDGALLVGKMAKSLKDHGTFDVASMSPEEFGAAKALIRPWPSDPATGYVYEPTAFGVGVNYTVNMTVGDQTKKVTLNLDNDPRRTAMRDALRKRVLNADRPGAPSLPKAVRSAESSPRDECDFLYIGVRPADRIEGMRRAVRAVDRLATKITEDSQKAASDLLKGLGYAPLEEGLPESLRNKLRETLSDNWKNVGFSSREEAQAFLANAGAFQVQTNLTLRMTIKPGDPARGIPSVGGEYQFLTVPGAAMP